MSRHTPSMDAKYYVGYRDTRWDVYPQREQMEIIAHDWYGFYAISDNGQWFKSPTSYVFAYQIALDVAEAACTVIAKVKGETQ